MKCTSNSDGINTKKVEIKETALMPDPERDQFDKKRQKWPPPPSPIIK